MIEEQRGIDPVFVFPYRRHRVTRMHNTAWKRSRGLAAQEYPKVFGRDCPEGLRNIRVHDLKHTFGRRLRATGVSFEDRQDLLGHKSGRITTHYSAVELQNLIDAANRVCEEGARKSPVMVLLRSAQPCRAIP